MRHAIISNGLVLTELCPEIAERNSLRYVRKKVVAEYVSTAMGMDLELSAVDEAVDQPMFTPLVDGTFIGPRHLATHDELVEWGYTVEYVKPTWRPHREMLRASHIECRTDAQQQAYDRLQEIGNGFLVLAPGIGKTVLALKYASERGFATLVLLENGGILQQWVQEAVTHLKLPTSAIGVLRQKEGTHDWKNKAIVVAMYRSLLNRLADGTLPPEFLWHWGTVIWDEAHHAQAPLMSQTLPMFWGNRVALSATPHSDGREALYFAHIGPPIFEYRTPDIVPTVFFHPVKLDNIPFLHPGSMRSHSKMLDMCENAALKPKDAADGKGKGKGKEASGEVHARQYLNHVAQVLTPMIQQGHEMLIIGRRTAGMRYLRDQLPSDPAVIDASTPFEFRPTVCKENQVVLVSKKIGEEALNKPATTRVVSLTPLGGAAKSAIQQTAGRGTRALAGKESTEYHVFFLDCAYGLLAAKRMQTQCEELGYRVEQPPAKTERPELKADPQTKSMRINRLLRNEPQTGPAADRSST